MSYYLIEFHNSMITESLSSKTLHPLLFKFEDYIIDNSRLSDAFLKARQIYEIRDKEELSEEEQELMSEKNEILNNLFDINYHGYDTEYIECQDGYIYYLNSVDNFGLLLGGIEGHFIQELYNDYIN